MEAGFGQIEEYPAKGAGVSSKTIPQDMEQLQHRLGCRRCAVVVRHFRSATSCKAAHVSSGKSYGHKVTEALSDFL